MLNAVPSTFNELIASGRKEPTGVPRLGLPCRLMANSVAGAGSSYPADVNCGLAVPTGRNERRTLLLGRHLPCV
jgi:hypothetical protein